jgi:hypothetical protein
MTDRSGRVIRVAVSERDERSVFPVRVTFEQGTEITGWIRGPIGLVLLLRRLEVKGRPPVLYRGRSFLQLRY